MGYALLGRRLRRQTDDSLQAESLLILIVAGLTLGALLVQQFAWALLRDAVLADPFGPWALGFWASQLAVGAAFAVGAVWGFKPGVTVTCTPTAVCIRPDGGPETAVPLDEVTAVRRLDARVFHRHYRRYRRTRVFVNRIEDEVVLLRTPDGPVILGLSEPDRTAFLDLLAPRPTAADAPYPLESARVA